MKKMAEKLKPYAFFGLELKHQGKESVSECVFCGGKKFYINNTTGLYSCKTCNKSGNLKQFLSAYHQLHLEKTTDNDLKKISRLRGSCFSVQTLKTAQLCLDDAGCVLFPEKRPGGKYLDNLRKWQPKNKVFYNTPGQCTLHYEKWSDEGPVYICEGEWDALALKQLMVRAKHDSPCAIVSVPGANIFNDLWVKHFKKRNVFLLYDNDHDKERPNGDKFNPAKDGMKMAADKLKKVASSIQCIDWEQVQPGLPDKYDVRDYLIDAIKAKKSKLFLKKLLQACKPAGVKLDKANTVVTLPRKLFEEVVEDWKSCYSFDQSFEDVLACCFAVLASMYMSDRRNPLWLFVVAPPASGKTSIIEGFKSATEHVEFVSELTPASIVTGLRYDSDNDPSLLNVINNKILFIEDFTPILGMPSRDEVFGIFRAAYNGFYTARFATGVKDYDDLYFGLVAGVTPAIERVQLGDLGERFLRIKLLSDDFDEYSHVIKALNNVGQRDEQKKQLLGGVNGYIRHLIKQKLEPEYPQGLNEKLSNLSMLTALLRAEVHKDKAGNTVRPFVEVASRIATQLKKLGLALAVVYQRKQVDENCYRVMQKVALDSCSGWFLELVKVMSPRHPLTNKEVAKLLNVHPNQSTKTLKDAMQLGIVEITDTRKKNVLRKNTMYYRLTNKVKRMIKNSEVSFLQRGV